MFRTLPLALALALAAPALAAPSAEPSARPTPKVAPAEAPWAFQAPKPAVRAKSGAVASVSEVASRIGVETLKKGGNAIDAAIAVAFALAVVYPEAGNIGGGGFMTIRLANGETVCLDYREKAPGKASRDMYLDAEGNLTDKSLIGSLAAGVPGTVAGLEAAHQRYGKLPWASLVAPAIALAEQGFVVNDYLAGSMRRSYDLLVRFPETRRVLLPGGSAPKAGSVLKQADLGKTLRRIQKEGAKGFYHGPVAQAIAKDQAATGGIITTADLAAYRPAWRAPVSFTYRGHKVISMPPPSSGGVTLAQILNILEGYDLKAAGWHSPQHIHWMIEAERRAYADRNAYLGDPDFIKDQPLETLSSKAYAAKRRATILPDKATPAYGLTPGLSESEDTTHFSVVDRFGNAVSNTYTLNGNFGAGVIAKGTGVLLNNEMDDFASKPGTPNLFGLVQGERNAIAPNKRMLSSMTPSIVLDPKGQLLMVIGSPGGSTIITTVAQVVSNVIDFGMPLNSAIAAPRVHHQGQPNVLFYEPAGLPHATRSGLVDLGHQTQQRDYIGDAMGVLRRPDGTLEAYADPRRGGQAVGY